MSHEREDGVAGSDNARDGRKPLSAREREILGLLAEGMSGTAIAEQLVLSPETVRTHVRNATRKLGAATRSQAVAMALGRGDIGAGASAVAELDGPARAKASQAEPDQLDDGDREALLGALLAGMASLADVEAGVIYLTDETGMGLRLAAIAEARSDPRLGAREEITLGEGPIGRVALERRTQLLPAGAGGPSALNRAVIASPMVADGRLTGVLCLAIRDSRPTSRREMLLLEAFANRVAEVLRRRESVGPNLKLALRRFRSSWTGSLNA